MSKTYADFRLSPNPNGPEEQYFTCPECSPQRKKKKVKCLAINVVKECWLCQHCGWKGSLQAGANHSDPHWQKPDYRKPKLLPDNEELPSNVVTYFAGRGIGNKTLVDNKIRYGSVYMPQVEEFVNAICIPFFRAKEHVNSKWRDGNKNFRMEAGAELILYGLDDIADSPFIVWVEGEMDKLSLYEAGIRNCVSPPNGAPSPESKNYSSHFDYLMSAEASIEGKEHILFLDNDDAGRLLESELARRLGRESCKRVRLPDGYKDANEYLIDHGPKALKEAVESAQPFPVVGIYQANSLIDGVRRLHKEGIKGGVSTGWLALDQYYTVRQGEVTLVTGIPNHGKSNFLDCVTINITKKEGWRFGVFSPEHMPLERHAAGYLEKLTSKAFNTLPDSDIEVGMASLNDHYFWILPELGDDWTLDGILEKAKVLVYRFGINGLIIDPWNYIEHRRPKSLSESEYIGSALTKIKQFAVLYNIHIWIVAHPTKMLKDQKSGDYPVPTPYDVSGSANWRNKVDNSLTVYRVGLTDVVQIHAQKIKYKEVGKLGMCKLRYQPDSSTYYEVSAYDE